MLEFSHLELINRLFQLLQAFQLIHLHYVFVSHLIVIKQRLLFLNFLFVVLFSLVFFLLFVCNLRLLNSYSRHIILSRLTDSVKIFKFQHIRGKYVFFLVNFECFEVALVFWNRLFLMVIFIFLWVYRELHFQLEGPAVRKG